MLKEKKMIEHLIAESRNHYKMRYLKFILIGILALGSISALGFAPWQQQTNIKPPNSKIQLEDYSNRPDFQGGYGVVREIDDDNNPALDFSILSYSEKDQIVEQKFRKSPPSNAKTFLLWVHRDYDSEKENMIDAIRNEIKRKPFRVQLFGDYVKGPIERDGTKYEAMIRLNALIIWNSIDDFANLCDGVMLGKSFVIEGVLGSVISRQRRSQPSPTTCPGCPEIISGNL